MIVLNKKRITLIITSVFIAVFVLLSDGLLDKDKYVATVSLPVSNKVIIIDAGHGIPDERSRKFEWNI